jgi:hypothetical protein
MRWISTPRADNHYINTTPDLLAVRRQKIPYFHTAYVALHGGETMP